MTTNTTNQQAQPLNLFSNVITDLIELAIVSRITADYTDKAIGNLLLKDYCVLSQADRPREERLVAAGEYFIVASSMLKNLNKMRGETLQVVGNKYFDELRITTEEFDVIEDGLVDFTRNKAELAPERVEGAIGKTREIIRKFRDICKHLY